MPLVKITGKFVPVINKHYTDKTDYYLQEANRYPRIINVYDEYDCLHLEFTEQEFDDFVDHYKEIVAGAYENFRREVKKKKGWIK